MSDEPKCGKGWSVRCARSKSPRCRCKCGGANHGKQKIDFVIDVPAGADPQEVLELLEFNRRHANYLVLDRDALLAGMPAFVIRDVGPWDSFPTVTNDAEWVVEQLAPELEGRRLFYYDSDGELDELVIVDGRFSGYAPGPFTPAGRVLA